MSEGKRPRSIWKRYEEAKVEAKKEDSEKLYYRIGRKSGRVETNLLEWERTLTLRNTDSSSPRDYSELAEHSSLPSLGS